MKYIIPCFITCALACGAFAQEMEKEPQIMAAAAPPQGMRGAPVNLPDISVIGVLNGHVTDDKSDPARNRLEFDEVETAFQGYIYPEMRADVFLAIHNHDGEYETEICEAKASFLKLLNGLSAEAGKIHVNFGKLNKIHTHHRSMADQPRALTNFFGGHGLVGQGGVLQYLLPLPFFAQLEGGAWRMAGHHHHSDETAEVSDINNNTVNAVIQTESGDFSLADEVYTGRLRTSFAPSAKSELELGASIAKGRGAHYTHHKDKAVVAGADLTFRSWPSAYGRWVFQNEWLYLTREVPAGKLYRHGFYSWLNCRFSKYWDIGGRFDYADGALPVNSIERALSGILSYHLTETSCARFQYKNRKAAGKKINEGWVQFAFGIGPHSHELE